MDQVQKRVSYFNFLTLLNSMHLECYLWTSLPSRLAILALFGVNSAVALIRFRHHLVIHEIIFVVQLLIWCMLLPFLFIHVSGKIAKDAKKLLVELSKCPNSKLVNKTLKSLRPFGIRVGLCKALSYNMLNTFYFIVIKSLTTMLVSIQP